MIVLLLVSTSQKTQVSNLLNSNSSQRLVVPNGWVRIVNFEHHFCLSRGLFWISRHQEPCDIYDDKENWKIIANTDGSYNILNKGTNEYLATKWENAVVVDYAKNPQNFFLVPLKDYPQVFSIQPSNNRDLCYHASHGRFNKCEEGLQIQLYYIDTTSTDLPIIPNIYYLLSWDVSDKESRKCLSDKRRFFDCSYQSPNQAFKFVPVEDGSNTYQIINGVGLALEMNSQDSYKDVRELPVEGKPSNSSNPNQRWRIIRSPRYPEKVFLRLPHLGYCLYYTSWAHHCEFYEDYNMLIGLNVPCSDEIVFPNTWYIFRWGVKNCNSVDLNSGRLLEESCEFSDRFQFKFVVDSNTKRYTIYNKALGEDKVLSVAIRSDGSRDYSRPNPYFLPKIPGGHPSQSWNTTKRDKEISLGFELMTSLDEMVLLSDRYSGGNHFNVVVQSLEFKFYMNGPLSSIGDNQQEILGVPKLKPPVCRAKYLYQMN